ncbi:hypothetical protein JCM17961_40560 [Endothiovibrio diazotrophicus]
MEMIGKDNYGVDGERTLGANDAKSLAEPLDVLHQEWTPVFGDDGEEVGGAFGSGPAKLHGAHSVVG